MSTADHTLQERAHELLKTIIETNPGLVIKTATNPHEEDQALQESIKRMETLYESILKAYRKNN